MNGKAIAVGIALTVLAGAFLTCAAVLSADAATTERSWWPLNTNITVDSSTVTKYVRAGPGEIVTINWMSDNMTSAGGSVYISLKPMIPGLNWTNMTESNGMYSVQWDYHDGPPVCASFRSGGYDVAWLKFQPSWTAGYNWLPVTFNITVTRDDYSFGPDTKGLEDKIAALQKQLDDLDIDALRASINDLKTAQAALNADIKSLRDIISKLQTQVDEQAENDTALSNALASLNASVSESLRALEDASALNDAALDAEITLLDEKVGKLPTNSTVTNTTVVVPNDYNDTALRDEIAKLKAAPPVVQYNNTTQVHPATYTTKTVTQKNEVNTALAIVAGAVSGVLTALITGVIMYAWMRKRYGGVVKPADSI